MGFAGGYLLKHAPGQRLIREDPDQGLNIIVIIPCNNESGLQKSLDSLFNCDTTGIKAEIIIFINASEDSSEVILNQNKETYRMANSWIIGHPHPNLQFHAILDNSLPGKDAGVGLARKTIMDEAVRRYDALDKPGGIILSLDADALVDTDYFVNIQKHFEINPKSDGCSIYFEHPIEGSEFSEEVYNAVSKYELHLRYYVHAIAYTGYPYASHTVGSSFAVKALPYCQHGGMNKRSGGEDFYFIQKVSQNGRFSNCISTRITPSPRPSDRVPFGTGPTISRMLSNPGQPFVTYNPESFIMLAAFFNMIEKEYEAFNFNPDNTELHPVLKNYLREINFKEALEEIRSNSASYKTFMKRFWRYFNMFRILKFLHFAREAGVQDIPISDAAEMLLNEMNIKNKLSGNLMELLLLYRKLDKEFIPGLPQ